MKRLMFLVSCAVAFSNLCAQDLAKVISRAVPNTIDIRSIGMGKTEVAANSGSNALFTNPSLLALQEKGTIKLGSAINFGFMKDEVSDELADLEKSDIEYGYKPRYKFTNISFALPFHIQASSVPISFAFGTGFQNAINLSFSEYYKKEWKDATGKYSSESNSIYTGGLNTITPGFSFGVLDRISAGISFNIGFGKLKYEAYAEDKAPLSPTQEGEMVTTIPGKAFFPTFGISGKPLENMTIGLSISPSYKWELDDGEGEIDYDGESVDFDIDGGEFKMPLKFSVGMECQITPNVALAIEYQMRPFNSLEFEADDPEGDLGSLESHIKDMDLKNGHVLHAGAEFLAGKAPLRFGFFLEPYATTDYKITSSGDTKSDETPNYLIGGTFGFGIPIGEIALIEAAAQYGRLKSTIEAVYNNKKTGYDQKHHLFRVDVGVKIDLPSINIKTAASATSPSKPQQSKVESSPVFPSQQSQPVYQTPQYNQETYPSYQQTPPAENSGSVSPTDQGSYQSESDVFENQNSDF